MPNSIFEFVQKQRDDYRSNTIEVAEGYDFSQYQTLNTIELYHNSKFTKGNKDSLGREIPFYNICKFRVNVATRATDIDTKDVTIESDGTGKEATTTSFLLSLKNRNWMRRAHFAAFLNRTGFTRSKYGGVLVKKTEQADELGLHVPDWRNMITDQVDIRNGVKIERHYYTPAQLKTDAPKNWKNIDDAIEAARKSQEANASRKQKDQNRTPGAYIEVYEVHGVLPDSFLPTHERDPDAEHNYSRQMHIVVLDESNKDAVGGVSLYEGIEQEDPYKYLPYEEVAGRGLGVGVIEDLFEAQVWTNYGVKQKKDLLDLAGKIIFQTSDGNIAAKNVLTDIENGQIITTAPNAPITQVNNVPASIGGLTELIDDWNTQAENITSTYPAILGQTPPSGTAYHLIAAMNQEAAALFAYRRQEVGIFISEIYEDWILPFLVRQMKQAKELTATLEPEELVMLSEAVADAEALKFAKQQVLAGKLVYQQDIDAIRASIKSQGQKMRRRGFTEFADLFDDWSGTVEVNVTGEQQDKQTMLSILFQLFGAVAQNPQLLENPTLARIFNQIVATAGVSPLFMQPTGEPAAPQLPAAIPSPVQQQPPVTNAAAPTAPTL